MSAITEYDYLQSSRAREKLRELRRQKLIVVMVSLQKKGLRVHTVKSQ
jgi:hypothetical protein